MANIKLKVEEFKKQFAEREQSFEVRMNQLRNNIDNGTAGVIKEHGQWHIEVGQNATFDEVFGKGLNKTHNPQQ